MTDDECDRAVLLARSTLKEFPQIIESRLIGSGLYMPAAQASDLDYALLLPEHHDPLLFANGLIAHGFMRCGTYDKDIGEDVFWTSMRCGHVNFMITNRRSWFDDYLAAMEVCRYLQLEKKRDRIAVCRIVRDRKSAADVRKMFELEDGS